MIGFILSLKSRQATKERLLTRFLKGLSKERLDEMGRSFAQEQLHTLLKSHSLERLRWHREQGHRCILISASIAIYLKPWAASNGFQDVICSQLAFDAQGHATGQLQGLNCWGEEKAHRLLELLGPRAGFTLYAYGDSRGDRELLAMADYPVKL